MAVIPYTRMTAAPGVNAALPAGLARVSQGLLREASKLHVAQGWGPAIYADGESTQLVAWGASNVWRTFAAFLEEVDPAQTWYATIRCSPLDGDVAVRGSRSGDGVVVSSAGLYTIPVTPIALGSGLALFEIQLLSKRVPASDESRTLTWLAPDAAAWVSVRLREEIEQDADPLTPTYVHHTQLTALGGSVAVALWSSDGRPTSAPTATAYTAHELTGLQVLGIAIHATSDGQPYADTLGLTPTLRNTEHDHRREAAELVRTRPRQICAMGRPIVSDSTHTNARRWTQRVILDGTEQSIADGMLVDEQSSYRVHAVLIHNGTAPLPLRIRVYVDGNEVASTVYNLPPLAADSFLRWSLNLPMVVSGSFPISETDAWYEPTESLPRVTVQTQLVSSPGALSITVEQVGPNATRLGIVALTVVPVRAPQSVAWLPFASRIGSILDFLRAPNRPYNEIRREVANWERLDADTTDVAATVWRASPVAGITLTCDAVLTDTILTVQIIDDDGVTLLDTLTLDATGTTAQLSATSIALTGGESYYIGVSTAEVTAGAVASVRLYETQGADPSMALSVEYASRSALLADTGQDTGATGYAPSYAAPTMVRQWDGAAWIVVSEIWDGVTSGQTVAALATQVGVTNAIIYFSDTERVYQYDGAAWVWITQPITVANFAGLSAITAPPDGYLVTVTAQAGLSADTVVQWDETGGVWLLVSTVSAALPPRTGEWYNSGGVTVRSAEGALVLSGDLLYRWDASITVAAGAGGGTQSWWVPSEVYAGSPQVVAWAVGTENVTTDTVLNAQGFGTVERTLATIATSGDRIRFTTNTSGASLRDAAIKTLTSGVTGSTRCYSAIQVRGTVGTGTVNNSTFFLLGNFFDGANGVFSTWNSAVPSRGAFFWTGSGTVNAGAVVDNGAFPNLSSDDVLIEIIYTASTGIARMYRDATLIATCTRPASATADQLWIGARGGTTATESATMDLRFARVMTW
jgi:hypothetical protein